jgi:hypothetical protein
MGDAGLEYRELFHTLAFVLLLLLVGLFWALSHDYAASNIQQKMGWSPQTYFRLWLGCIGCVLAGFVVPLLISG